MIARVNTMTLVAAVLWFLSLTLVLAEEKLSFTTTDGTTYTDAVVTKIEPDGITVMYESGAAKILFGVLPETIQQKYHYNLKTAEAYHDKQRAVGKELEAQKRIRIETEALDAQIKGTAMVVELRTRRILQDGALCSLSMTEIHEEEYQVVRNSLANLILVNKEYETKKRTVKRQIPLPDTYLVVGLPQMEVGASWSGTVYECGSYSYTPAIGAMRTIYRYATQVDLARELIRKDNQADKE